MEVKHDAANLVREPSTHRGVGPERGQRHGLQGVRPHDLGYTLVAVPRDVPGQFLGRRLAQRQLPPVLGHELSLRKQAQPGRAAFMGQRPSIPPPAPAPGVETGSRPLRLAFPVVAGGEV
jgi:hypothetical protein